MPPTLRVDWFRVIVELERHGFTPYDISDQIETARSTVVHWRNDGTEPRHLDGERLIKFWSAATCKGREDLPMAVVEPTVAEHRR